MSPVLSAEQEEFQARVCALLCEESVRDSVARARRMPPGSEAGLLDVHRSLGDRGWLAVNWPKEYGGLDGSMADKAIVTEQLIGHGVPENLHLLGIDIIGLAITMVGTEAQKARLLPPLARGESMASVLFSEPGVGSDLSALRARAEPDGDGWRLYGRKIFSMKSQFADFALCAVRTTPSSVPYHGITLFLVPMNRLGVLLEPRWNITNERFNDVVLDGIRLTRDDVLGDVDDGWRVLNQVLPLERTGLDAAAMARRLFDTVWRHAADTGRLGDPAYAQRLVEIEARVRTARLLAWRCVRNIDRGAPDEVQSATAKWYATETVKELAGLALETTGLAGTLHARDRDTVADGLLELSYRETPGLTLAAGTSEIMLYVVAGRGLGLLT